MTTFPNWSQSDYLAAQPALDEWVAIYGLPRDLAYGLVAWESNFKASAFLLDRNGGSIGLTQISLPTASGLGYTGSAQGLYDRDTNAQFGLLYLRNQLDRYGGDWSQALSAYNAGSAITGNLQSYVANVLQRAAYFTQLFAQENAQPVDVTDTPDTSAVDSAASDDAGSSGPDPVVVVVGLGILAAAAYAIAKALA
ncbi:MAG TPA: transglycosylase SLT domain-containing protein [Polyangia bacterium]|nr:transglycosylase SLT domain-containing protein [Polyangia bacterium]